MNLAYFSLYSTLLLPCLCHSFIIPPSSNQFQTRLLTPIVITRASNTNNNPKVVKEENSLDTNIASQFKIVTCASTACKKKMNKLGLDEYAILGGLYQRKEDAYVPDVTVEEGSCLGGCKVGPCVGIEHEDFFGTVSLEGMKSNEFSDRIFKNIVTEDDLDRIWSCVENAIQTMMEEDDE